MEYQLQSIQLWIISDRVFDCGVSNMEYLTIEYRHAVYRLVVYRPTVYRPKVYWPMKYQPTEYRLQTLAFDALPIEM